MYQMTYEYKKEKFTMSDINNNAGLIRIDNVIEYRASTQIAEEFVNARISAAIAGWNKTTGATGTSTIPGGLAVAVLWI